ncbi:MAG TPA: helix-turn-helix transcriptional regulator, partial [Spirochaetia bacterium]|nr:helix-turn-helix transcriptional regulator [Spirochaetia bacterium]
ERAEPEPTRDELDRAIRALTRRERQVASLLCRDCPNSEIAARLFISRRTVESHVAHICSKLDVSSRRQAVTAIMQRVRAHRGR